MGTLLYLRLGLLVVLLLAVLVFHAHGRTLVVIQVVRIVLLVLVLASIAWGRRR